MHTYVVNLSRLGMSITHQSVTSIIRRKSSFRRARRFVGSLASRAVSRARARAASIGLLTHWLAGARQNMRVHIPSIIHLLSVQLPHTLDVD